MLRANGTLAGAIAPVPVDTIPLGWCTGGQVAADGTEILRCDVQGGWRKLPGASKWDLACSALTMLPAERKLYDLGCYDAAIAWSNADFAAMITMGRLKLCSNFKSAMTFRNVAALPDFVVNGTNSHGANSPTRMYQSHMEFDPARPQTLWVGLNDRAGVIKFDNVDALQAATPATIGAAEIPAPVPGWGKCIAFDRSSGITGGKTNTLYIHSAGTANLYKINQISGAITVIAGAPAICRQLRVNPVSGVVIAIDSAGQPRRWTAAGGWTNPVCGWTAGEFTDVVFHPTDGGKAWLVFYAGQIAYSSDGGQNFGTINSNPFSHANPPFSRQEDVPIVQFALADSLAASCGWINPVSGALCVPNGLGYSLIETPPTTTNTFVYKGLAKGICNFVGITVLTVPATGKSFVIGHDKAILAPYSRGDWTTPPPRHGPHNEYGLSHANSADFAADNPNHIILSTQALDRKATPEIDPTTVWHSLDAGATDYAPWPAQPSFIDAPGDVNDIVQHPSNVAMGTSGNAIMVGQSGGAGMRVMFSANYGAWTPVDFGSAAINAAVRDFPIMRNWRFSTRVLAADKERPNTFYLYIVGLLANDGTPHAQDAALKGVWRLVINPQAGTCTAARVHAKRISETWAGAGGSFAVDTYHCKLVLGPGGSAWFTAGQNSSEETKNPTLLSFTANIDQADSWNNLPAAPTECRALMLGAAAPGASYPAVAVYAEHDGHFVCTNFDPVSRSGTWQLLPDPPSGVLDMPIGGDGDRAMFGSFAFTGGNTGLTMATEYRASLGQRAG